jgi:hypothetical protein
MQKQLVSAAVAIFIALAANTAEAQNPLVRHRDTQALAKGGGTTHSTVHAASVDHRVNRRPEHQANRYMRNEHMSSPMQNTNPQTEQHPLKYNGGAVKKSSWW